MPPMPSPPHGRKKMSRKKFRKIHGMSWAAPPGWPTTVNAGILRSTLVAYGRLSKIQESWPITPSRPPDWPSVGFKFFEIEELRSAEPWQRRRNFGKQNRLGWEWGPDVVHERYERRYCSLSLLSRTVGQVAACTRAAPRTGASSPSGAAGAGIF